MHFIYLITYMVHLQVKASNKARYIWYSGGGGGGEGAWIFGPGQESFFGQNWSKIICFSDPSGRIIFFKTESYIYDI